MTQQDKKPEKSCSKFPTHLLSDRGRNIMQNTRNMMLTSHWKKSENSTICKNNEKMVNSIPLSGISMG